jgi:hypothetical protein
MPQCTSTQHNNKKVKNNKIEDGENSGGKESIFNREGTTSNLKGQNYY